MHFHASMGYTVYDTSYQYAPQVNQVDKQELMRNISSASEKLQHLKPNMASIQEYKEKVLSQSIFNKSFLIFITISHYHSISFSIPL